MFKKQLLYLDINQRRNVNLYDTKELIHILVEKYGYNMEVNENNILGTYKKFITIHLRLQPKSYTYKIYDLLNHEAQEWIKIGIKEYKKDITTSLIKLLRQHRDLKKFVTYLYTCDIL